MDQNAKDATDRLSESAPEEPLGRTTAMTRRLLIYLSIGGFIMLVLVAGGAYYLGLSRQRPEAQETTAVVPDQQLAVTNGPMTTLPPPLAKGTFPSQAIDYPSSWPADLRYPEQFNLVEASSGVLSESASTGWAAKLRYKGDPRSTADLLASFFTTKGWQVVERTELDSGGYLILIERDNKKSSGAVIIDPATDAPGTTNIVATIFP